MPDDRQAYLEEQIARQKRGEPIDVEWVKAELKKVRKDQADMMARTQRRLRLLVLVAAILLAILWIKNDGPSGSGGIPMLGLILIGFLATFALGRKKR